VGKSSDHAVARRAFTTATPAPLIGFGDPAREDRTVRLESLSNDFEAEPVEPGEGGQVGAAEADRRGSVGHVEVFRMGSVRTSILGRPRRLSWDRRANDSYTLNWEEPVSPGSPLRG